MNLLEEIIQHKRTELRHRGKKSSITALSQTEHFRGAVRSLQRSLHDHHEFGVIAEIKKASPTAGMLNTKFRPAEIAKMYQEAGASAISILTDEKYFHGSLSDLGAVREHTSLPLLRKDFILEEIQLFEAKAFGADAVLLIAAALDKHQLKDLHCAARELGLETLVELYESREIDNIDFDQMKLIGINNRDLKTFTVDIQRSIYIASLLPNDIMAVSESGIASAFDLLSLRKGGIQSALIGESLMKSEHPGKALRSLMGEFNRVYKG